MRARTFQVARACLAALGGLAGCVGVPPRPSEIGQADGVIRAATVDGAAEDMSASLYLDLALEELRLARAKVGVNDGRGARSWAIRAWADAQVAWMVALEIKARREAQRGWDEVSRIMDEQSSMEMETRRHGEKVPMSPCLRVSVMKIPADQAHPYVARRMAERARIAGLLRADQDACARAHATAARLRAHRRGGSPARP